MVDATQVQIRRGTQAECESMVPVEGEVICDLTNDTLRVGDGSKVGGHLMPNVARMQSGQYMFATAGGTANAITVDLAPAVAALVTGMEFRFLAVADNTGAVTLALNGLAATQIRKIQSGSPVPLAANDISSGVIYNVVYDGTYFVLFSGSGGGIVAPVAGSTYDIYRDFDGTGSTSATSYPSIDYTNVAVRSRNILVNAAGSVRIYVEHRGESGPGGFVTMALNGTTLQTWSNTTNNYVARTFDSECASGDVITVRQRANPASGGGFSAIRNLMIKSDTPAYGAVSG